jgi:hypothetical protein
LGTAITSWFLTNTTGEPSPLPASVTVFMVGGLAAAKTSAGAPWLICVASAELLAKLKVTLEPGLAASKSLPIRVNDSVSEAAAKTVRLPVTPAVVGVSSLPQPARATAATSATPTARIHLYVTWVFLPHQITVRYADARQIGH